MNIVLCGAGALGSQLLFAAARPEMTGTIIDFDRVEYAANVASGTTVYGSPQVGAYKAVALAEIVYRLRGARFAPDTERLTTERVTRVYQGFREATVVVDAFDNLPARSLLCGRHVPVLHVAVSNQGTGVVAWDNAYQLPESVDGPPVCTHQLGVRLLRFTAAIAANVLDTFLADGVRLNKMVTQGLGVIDYDPA